MDSHDCIVGGIMSSYTNFARVYDTFMDDVPYDEWSEYVQLLLMESGVKEGLLLELGCGTGSMTRRLSQKGYDMIGLDISGEMLDIAYDKEIEGENEILYLHQDMRAFELYGTVKGIVSICDSLNYVLENEEVLEVFRLVNNYLDPGGVFIFDLNTKYKYESILGEQVIAENRENCSFIWENYYDEEERINEYDLTLFVKESDSEMYQKYSETHYQRAYEIKEITDLLMEAELEVVAVYDAFTKKTPTDESERIYFIAKEKNKKKTIESNE